MKTKGRTSNRTKGYLEKKKKGKTVRRENNKRKREILNEEEIIEGENLRINNLIIIYLKFLISMN